MQIISFAWGKLALCSASLSRRAATLLVLGALLALSPLSRDAKAQPVDVAPSAWAGLELASAATAGAGEAGTGAYVQAVHPDGPAKAGGLLPGDLIVAINKVPTLDPVKATEAIRAGRPGQTVAFQVVRGKKLTLINVTLGTAPKTRPLWNAERAKPRKGFLSSWASATPDPIRVGEVLEGVIESSDSLFEGSRGRVDMYLVEEAASGRHLRVIVDPRGEKLTVRLYQDECPGGAPLPVETRETDKAGLLSLGFTAAARCSYLTVHGPYNDKPYDIYLRDQTPFEFAFYQRQLRDRQIAEQQRQKQEANEPSMFGAMVRGLAMGFSGVEAPLMNADGSEPNTLDVLNAANTELARQNAEGRARLDATIAQAQYQASSPSDPSTQNGPQGILGTVAESATYTPPPASSAPPQAPAQPAFQLSKPTESYCSYWHRPRAGDREYEQCSPGDENCTCADAAKVSNQ